MSYAGCMPLLTVKLVIQPASRSSWLPVLNDLPSCHQQADSCKPSQRRSQQGTKQRSQSRVVGAVVNRVSEGDSLTSRGYHQPLSKVVSLLEDANMSAVSGKGKLAPASLIESRRVELRIDTTCVHMLAICGTYIRGVI